MIPIQCAVILLCLAATASPIEVHEDVNENPVEMVPILNPTSPSASNSSTAADRSLSNVTSDEETMLPQHGLRHASQGSMPTPKNHKLSTTLTSPHGQTSLSPEVAVSTASSSAFPMPSSQVNTGGDIPQETAGNHHIPTGYKKRQLHTDSRLYELTNETNGRSFDKQTAKMFMPSPQLTDFYVPEDALIPSPKYRGALASQHVDAPYPASLGDSGSNWFGVDRVPEQHLMEILNLSNLSQWYHHRNGNPLRLPNVQPPQAAISPPEFDLGNVYKQPKGKWKWVAEDEETTRSSVHKPNNEPRPPVEFQDKHVNSHHLYSGPFSAQRTHPYSFEIAPGQGPSGSSSISSDSRPVTGGLAGEILTASEPPKDSGKGHDLQRVASPWKPILQMLSAAIPIGILISALTPQVVHVNPNATISAFQMPTPSAAPGFNRHRSDSSVDSQLMAAANNLLNDCDKKKFCQLTVMGREQQASVVNRILWKNANETPADRARMCGLEEIFEAAKRNDCQRFKCA